MCFKKTNKRKILKTTDGYFDNKSHIKKPRLVVVIEERDDTAIGVVKIHSKNGKDNTALIKNVVIKPIKNRTSIKEESVLGSRLHIGRKIGNKFEPLYIVNFRDTNEKITLYEYAKIKSNIQNDTKGHRKTYKNKVKNWKNHFRK